DTFIFGSDGDDALLSFNPAGVMSGGSGNDSIYSDGAPNEIVFGDSGNDCFFSAYGVAQTFNCGDGFDVVSTSNGSKTPVNAVACEGTTPNGCPRSLIP